MVNLYSISLRQTLTRRHCQSEISYDTTSTYSQSDRSWTATVLLGTLSKDDENENAQNTKGLKNASQRKFCYLRRLAHRLATHLHWFAQTCEDLQRLACSLHSIWPPCRKWAQVVASKNLHRLALTWVSFGQGFNEEKQWLCTLRACVSHFCTFLCRSLQKMTWNDQI